METRGKNHPSLSKPDPPAISRKSIDPQSKKANQNTYLTGEGMKIKVPLEAMKREA